MEVNRKQLEKLSDSELRAALKSRRLAEKARLKDYAAIFGLGIAVYHSLENAAYGMRPYNRERVIAFLSGQQAESFETPDGAAIRRVTGILSALSVKEQRRVVRYLVEKFTE